MSVQPSKKPKIQNIQLYEAVYQATLRLAKKNLLPVVSRHTNERVYRSVPPGTWYTGPAAALKIAPGSDTSDDNRFSGVRPDGRPGNGALYLGSWDGVRCEVEYYNVLQEMLRDNTVNPTLLEAVASGSVNLDVEAFYGRKSVEARLTKDVSVVDIAGAAALLQQDAQVQRFLRHGVEHEIVSDDYSFCRGMAHGVYDAKIAARGVTMQSARAWTQKTGQNIVFFDSMAEGGTLPLQALREFDVIGRSESGKTRVKVRTA